ncbi:Transcription initiation factor IIA subunit 2 [Tupaia chinensis]|uniref:Transcription initiation factor IIA subunit 2 n=1 Tax=Tupaia chinensis TaxID=246437 RepID=L9L9J6_TUPCH|nr:Transcription initiation factor IIA subunit 2 [Tupaia chinensis]
MAYQLYRNTTLGNSLQESLDELIQGSLNTYRFCDNVWTFVLNDVEFREVTELIKVDKVKIVACDGKKGAGDKHMDHWGSKIITAGSRPYTPTAHMVDPVSPPKGDAKEVKRTQDYGAGKLVGRRPLPKGLQRNHFTKKSLT